jgi:polyhydroxybutyrate depolymerase
VETVALSFDGRERSYVLVSPRGPAAPLWMFLHGMGCTADWAIDETGLDSYARALGIALVAPQALRPKPHEPAKFLTNAPRWNDGAKADEADDVAFLDAVLTDSIARTGADANRIFVSGFSNGAAMSFRFASERANRVAAVAPVAGHCWIEPKPARPVPTLYLIGDRDPLVPIRGGEIELPWGNRLVRRPSVLNTLERWAEANRCSPISDMVLDGAIREERFPGPVPFRAVTVCGLGHHWPGGKGQLNPRIGGPWSGSVDANELLWSFFQSVSADSRS